MSGNVTCRYFAHRHLCEYAEIQIAIAHQNLNHISHCSQQMITYLGCLLILVSILILNSHIISLTFYYFDSFILGHGYLVIDPMYTIECCGHISKWELYVKNAGTVKMQVWRPFSNNSFTYELRGQTSITVSKGKCIFLYFLNIRNI